MESGNPWVNNRSFIVVFALVDTAIMLQGFEIFICNYFLHLSVYIMKRAMSFVGKDRIDRLTP